MTSLLRDIWMPFAEPAYEIAEVDAAGDSLIKFGEGTLMSPSEFGHALDVIDNWRSAHGHPLNAFQTTLRHKVRPLGPFGTVAQRTKRLPAIYNKLDRERWLKLSQMQDIGGIRAVLASIDEVKTVVDSYQRSRHDLIDWDDYISTPKRTGYRGYHLIFRYQSKTRPEYNVLKVELQIRTLLQHAWATAVETVDFLTGQSLKTGRGDKRWRRFFALMATHMALVEGCPPVERTPTEANQLRAILRKMSETLNVESRLYTFSKQIQVIEPPMRRTARFYVLQLDSSAGTLRVEAYRQDQLRQAYADAQRLERENFANRGNLDIVLVNVEKFAELQRTYQNYYRDTRVFIDELRHATVGSP